MMPMMASVPEGMERPSSWYAKVPIMMRMREVPVTTSNDAVPIIVVRMVANGSHLVLSTSLAKSCRIISAMYPHLVQVDRANRETWSGDWLLDTECVHVCVVAIPPPVRAPGVLERTS